MAKKNETKIVPPPVETNQHDALALRERVSEAFGTRAFEIRRDGLAPLCFNGRQLAEETSYTTGTRLWYELATYTQANDFILSIKVFKKNPAEKDIHRAQSFSNLVGLCAYVEAYEASHDITIVDDLTDAKLSTAEAMIRAAALRQRMDEARSEYRSVAGELLTRLVHLLA